MAKCCYRLSGVCVPRSVASRHRAVCETRGDVPLRLASCRKGDSALCGTRAVCEVSTTAGGGEAGKRAADVGVGDGDFDVRRDDETMRWHFRCAPAHNVVYEAGGV